MNLTIRTTDMERADDVYQGAKGYRVDRKGNLIVWGDHSKTWAIYAPGRWESAMWQRNGQVQ